MARLLEIWSTIEKSSASAETPFINCRVNPPPEFNTYQVQVHKLSGQIILRYLKILIVLAKTGVGGKNSDIMTFITVVV